MLPNYPPGVTSGMIPGNRPEDAAWEVFTDDAVRDIEQAPAGILLHSDEIDEFLEWLDGKFSGDVDKAHLAIKIGVMATTALGLSPEHGKGLEAAQRIVEVGDGAIRMAQEQPHYIAMNEVTDASIRFFDSCHEDVSAEERLHAARDLHRAAQAASQGYLPPADRFLADPPEGQTQGMG